MKTKIVFKSLLFLIIFFSSFWVSNAEEEKVNKCLWSNLLWIWEETLSPEEINECLQLLKANWEYISLSTSDFSINNNLFENFSLISDNANISISQEEIENKLFDWTPTSQPTFVDITFFQLKTINSLISSINHFDWIDLESIFDEDSIQTFDKWHEKFSEHDNKEDFTDSLTGSVTLKDVWIWAEIINWLSCSLLKNFDGTTTCPEINLIWHDDKFQFYDLENDIFDIADQTTTNYSKIFEWIEDIQDDIEEFEHPLDELLISYIWWVFQDWDEERANIWDNLSIRLDNINKIIKEEKRENINLRWFFNFYYELNSIWNGIQRVSTLYEPIKQQDDDKIYENIWSLIKFELYQWNDNLFWFNKERFVETFFEYILSKETSNNNEQIRNFAEIELERKLHANKWEYNYDSWIHSINNLKKSENGLVDAIIFEWVEDAYEHFSDSKMVTLCPNYKINWSNNKYFIWNFVIWNSCKFNLDIEIQWDWYITLDPQESEQSYYVWEEININSLRGDKYK